MATDLPMPGKQPGQRRAAQFPPAVAQGLGYRLPRIAVRLRNGSALFGGPVACPALMLVGPAQDLRHGQARTGTGILDSALRSQEPGQGTAAWHPPLPVAQGHVDRPPCFTIGAEDRSILIVRPTARSSVVGISPFQHLSDRVFGQCFAVALTPVFGEQASQRATRTQAAEAEAQAVIDVAPLLISSFPHRPTTPLLWPLASPVKMGIRPFENLRDVKDAAAHAALPLEERNSWRLR